MVIFRSCADNLLGGDMGYVVPPTQNFGGDRPPLSPPWITPVCCRTPLRKLEVRPEYEYEYEFACLEENAVDRFIAFRSLFKHLYSPIMVG